MKMKWLNLSSNDLNRQIERRERSKRLKIKKLEMHKINIFLLVPEYYSFFLPISFFLMAVIFTLYTHASS